MFVIPIYRWTCIEEGVHRSVPFSGLEVVLVHSGVDVSLVGQEFDGLLHFCLGYAALQLHNRKFNRKADTTKKNKSNKFCKGNKINLIGKLFFFDFTVEMKAFHYYFFLLSLA